MGSSASKATSSSAASATGRHFPTAAETAAKKQAAAAAQAASSINSASSSVPGAGAAVSQRIKDISSSSTSQSTSIHDSSRSQKTSPREEYLAQQEALEAELAEYDEKIRIQQERQQQQQKSNRQHGGSRPIGQEESFDGSRRPAEDMPSAAEQQFFGNLRSLGQVKVQNPDQEKHREAEGILRQRKMPGKPWEKAAPASSNSTLTSKTTSPHKSTPEVASITPLTLMHIMQLRNKDPVSWTSTALVKEFSMNADQAKELVTVLKYVNTYSILPGKDAKGRETGVWSEDVRGVEVLDRPSSTIKDENAPPQPKEVMDRSTKKF